MELIHYILVSFAFFCSIFIYIIFPFTATKNQVALWSWFPLPAAWEASRSGCNWLTWTERSESIFLYILSNARNGKGKPRSHGDWVAHLRGQKVARVLIKQNNSRSQAFMDSMVPVSN